jgi:hypothetical protein
MQASFSAVNQLPSHTHTKELHSFLAGTFFILSPYQPTQLYSQATMVKLTEVEDEHFAEKPATTKDDALLANDDDDDDYTDTGTSLRELCSVSVPSQLFAHAIYCTGATQPIYYEGRSNL